MLKQEQRLSKNKDIELVLKRGQRLYGKNFNFYLLKSQSTKFTVIAGLKVSKKATERNLIKRRLREIIKKHLPLFQYPIWGVVVMKKEALSSKFSELEEELLDSFKKAHL